MVRGIVLTGGGSLLRGIADFLQQRFQVKVNLTKEPELTVIRGLGKILNDFGGFHEFFKQHGAF